MLHQAVDQVLSQSSRPQQARGLDGSARSARSQLAPMQPMEPIEEEKSELAMDIAQAVVEKLDIDGKLDERMKELMLKGNRIFRDIQVRQEQSTDALVRTVGICLESQRAFQEEHQRLLAAVKELATMVIPYTPLHSQALEASARAADIIEETETLRKQMEDHRLATAAAAAAAASLALPLQPPGPPHTSSQQPALVTSSTTAPSSMQLGCGTFSITLRKADEVSLGLSVNADEEESKALIVEAVLAGGAVESWNRQCIGDGTGERVVIPGDRIVKVNGIDNDVKKMLEECTRQRLVKLHIARNTHNACASPSRPSSTAGAAQALTPARQTAGAAAQEAVDNVTPEKSVLRKKAPEFVPSGPDAPPLKQTRHLAAPPGLFLPRHEDSSLHTLASDLSAKMDAAEVSQAYGVAVGLQDAGEDGHADKEG